MAMYDWDGTTTRELGKVYDWDGNTSHQLGKGYDWDGTTNSLIYSAEELIFDNGISYLYTPTVYLKDNYYSANGYHINFRTEGATIGNYLEVRHNSTYVVGNDWYSNNGRIDISGIDATGFTTVKFDFSTKAVSSSPNLKVKWNDTTKASYSTTTSGTGSFTITGGTNDKFTISCECTDWNTKGDYLRITKIWLE